MSLVVITGCSSGVGLEAALAFARRGDTVVATMRDLGRGGELQARAKAGGLTVHAREMNVTSDSSVAAAMAGIVAEFGPVDVLINNAGVMIQGAVEQLSMDDARASFETNVFGPARTVKAVVASMRERRSGVIVNVGSAVTRPPSLACMAWYNGSKIALRAVTESLYFELRPFGVRVHYVDLGGFATGVVGKGYAQRAPIDEGSEYAAVELQMRAIFDAAVDTSAPPSVAAAGLVACVEDPASPVHVPIGDDVARYLRQESWGFEEYVRRMDAAAAKATQG
ncbi:MAG: SDR family oxidoreductase [Dehalococcoidia bacterium]|nr:SDR family oxidoreductase [Dehalococcoidia bacterium]